MALGREDTDRVYDGAITHTLKSLGLTPRRIDRINHNDDIDDRILREIEHKDVVAAVADLTYARQSVYFEAGYAARGGTPVVYTVRRDHLASGSADACRVHFDLQMKNIIPWDDGRLGAFEKKLRARLRSVTRSALAKRAKDARAAEVAHQFEVKSVVTKKEELRVTADRLLMRHGWRRVMSSEGKPLGSWHQVRRQVGHVIMPWVLPRVTTRDVRYVVDNDWLWFDIHMIPQRARALCRWIAGHLVVATLKPQQASQLANWEFFSRYNVVSGYNSLCRIDDRGWRTKRLLCLHLLDNIISPTDFRVRLSALLRALPGMSESLMSQAGGGASPTPH